MIVEEKDLKLSKSYQELDSRLDSVVASKENELKEVISTDAEIRLLISQKRKINIFLKKYGRKKLIEAISYEYEIPTKKVHRIFILKGIFPSYFWKVLLSLIVIALLGMNLIINMPTEGLGILNILAFVTLGIFSICYAGVKSGDQE